jgi:hypothetical protein
MPKIGTCGCTEAEEDWTLESHNESNGFDNLLYACQNCNEEYRKAGRLAD